MANPSIIRVNADRKALGVTTVWNKATLDRMAFIRAGDIAKAISWWRRAAPPKMRDLLAAQPEDKG